MWRLQHAAPTFNFCSYAYQLCLFKGLRAAGFKGAEARVVRRRFQGVVRLHLHVFLADNWSSKIDFLGGLQSAN
jgi:hypothetical protein